MRFTRQVRGATTGGRQSQPFRRSSRSLFIFVPVAYLPGSAEAGDSIPSRAANLPVFTYLTMSAGPKVGASILLGDAAQKVRIGRQADCDIQLEDAVCSRLHAELSQLAGQWRISDRSRNGTYVNDERVEEQILADGDTLRMGKIEFTFHQSAQSPTTVERLQSAGFAEAAPAAEPADEPTLQASLSTLSAAALDYKDLCRLTLKLLNDDGVEQDHGSLALDFLHNRLGATSVAWLEWGRGETPRPRLQLPDSDLAPKLSASLQFLLLEQGRPVWTSHQLPADCRSGVTDSLWAPIAVGDQIVAVLFAGVSHGLFRQNHFDLVVGLSRIISEARRRNLERWARDIPPRSGLLLDAWPDHVLGASPAATQLRTQISAASQRAVVVLSGERGVEFELLVRQLQREAGGNPLPALRFSAADLNRVDAAQSGLPGRAWKLLEQGRNSGAVVWISDIEQLTARGQTRLADLLQRHGEFDERAAGAAEAERHPPAPGDSLRGPLWLILSGELAQDRQGGSAGGSAEWMRWLTARKVTVPPLRDRELDVEAWLDHFLAAMPHGLSLPKRLLTPAARSVLLAHRWPGNLVELQATLAAAMLRGPQPTIAPEDFHLSPLAPGEAGFDTLRWSIWEQRLVEAAIHQTGGNIAEAARLLGIGRATLYRKLEAQGRDDVE